MRKVGNPDGRSVQHPVGGYHAPRLWRQAVQWLVERNLLFALNWLHRDLPAGCRTPPGFALDPRDHIGARTFAAGMYEAREIQASLSIAKAFDAAGGLFLDVGAHMGTYSVTLGRAFDRVIAFEPNGRMYQLLRFNTYNLPHVECRKIGLSNRRARYALRVEPSNTGNASLHESGASFDHAGTCLEHAEVDTLDAQLAGMQQPVSFIKIDDEGHELQVLAGGREALSRDRPLVAIEYVRAFQQRSAASVPEFLLEMGYRLFAVSHRRPFGYRTLDLLHRLVRRPRLVITELTEQPTTDHRLVFAIPRERITEERLARLASGRGP
jgi:FkbM family methyltransferase